MLGGGPEQAALFFGNVELKFQNCKKSMWACGLKKLSSNIWNWWHSRWSCLCVWEMSFCSPLTLPKQKKSMCECGVKIRVRHTHKLICNVCHDCFFDALFDMTSWCFVWLFRFLCFGSIAAHDFFACSCEKNNVPMWN
jgi:hypothetical protein